MRVISLFSGAGGLDLGLIESGHKVVWANDIDADAVATYRRNIGSEIVHGDISELDVKSIPDADVVVGGFPCQGFSQANMLRSGDDERNALFKQFVRVLRAKKPKYFVAENVRGLLSLDQGRALVEILRQFRQSGYDVRYQVLNAADYGVPQNRQRVIFLGSRRDLTATEVLTFPSATHSRPGKPERIESLHPWVSIGEALRGLPDVHESHSLENHVCSKYKVTVRNFTGHRKTDPNKPSPTILARGNGKGGVCAIPHPYFERRLSVRESAIVQTFPLNFVFEGGLNSMYRQIGNAVAVNFAKSIGRSLCSVEGA